MKSRFLKSGFMSFLVGIVIIILYFYFSSYKLGGDISGTISIFNILFSLLFLFSCCITAFLYGKRKNKSGLTGLIFIFVLPLVTSFILMLFPPSYFILPQLILIPLYYISFFYATLFFPIIPTVYAPAIIIIFIICSWIIGKRIYSQQT